MTALIGGSVLLIAAAAIALVFGWIGADPALIWISIVASVAAGVLLALGYNRARAEIARSTARPSSSAAPPSSAPTPTAGQAATETQPAAVADSSGEVIAIPDRGRYHRADCRYANVKGAEPMTVAAARRRGFDPCGICKP